MKMIDLISVVIAIIIPTIPGVLLWVLLAPSDYYQMFMSVVLGCALYILSLFMLSKWANT